tara:strand:+ start:42 stop:404 length:363 start_codon:yes stop_codon:yes gene_type:complete
MEERTQEELEWYMERFTGFIQDHLNEHEKTQKYPDECTVVVKKGRKYWKIMVETPRSGVFSGRRTRIFGFVRRKDGAILRAANMKAPEIRTKNHVRGYIWEEDAGSTFSWTGINYDMASY